MNTTENQNDPYAQLQPEYLRSLCGGYEPHCINWTREMLPDGYRPLAKAEVIQNGVDEVYYEGATPKWHKCSSPEGTSAMPTMQHRRTKRPVEYRIAPDPAQTYHTPNVVQQCREEAAAINAAMNPAPAGKLTDEQLVEIGAKAGLATGEHSTYYKAFARAVREAVEAKQAEEIARLTAELAGQKAQSAKALGMALDLNLNLQNKADMWRDEFERIKAIEFSKHGVVESEIAGICDRAMSDIRSKISLIDQREKVADENGGLCVQLAKAGAEIATLTTRFEKEQQASAAATKQF
jgi:plasmid maintenance system antidote protein VapI